MPSAKPKCSRRGTRVARHRRGLCKVLAKLDLQDFNAPQPKEETHEEPEALAATTGTLVERENVLSQRIPQTRLDGRMIVSDLKAASEISVNAPRIVEVVEAERAVPICRGAGTGVA